MEKLKSRQKDINAILKKTFNQDLLKHDKYPAIRGYVIFSNIFDRNRVYKAFKRYQKNTVWDFCCPKKLPKKFQVDKGVRL